jgi:hypothetical protein
MGIRDAFEQTVRDFVVHGAGCELVRAPAPRVVRHAAASDAHDAEFFRQEFDFREIVQRRDHQPVGQIARDTEDHKGAGLRRLVGLEVCHERPAVCLTILGAFCGNGGSLWPGASLREIFSANVCSCESKQTAPIACVDDMTT